MNGKIHAGIAIPGGPPGLGDIWVDEMLIAQKGEGEVRRMVRETFDAAYKKHAEERRRKALAPPSRR